MTDQVTSNTTDICLYFIQRATAKTTLVYCIGRFFFWSHCVISSPITLILVLNLYRHARGLLLTYSCPQRDSNLDLHPSTCVNMVDNLNRSTSMAGSMLMLLFLQRGTDDKARVVLASPIQTLLKEAGRSGH